jgi:branched-chain amino acid transport system ATP-binding protein
MIMTLPPLLEGLDLHAFYGTRHVLRGVNIAIGAGEVLGLLGRNGMGKTTLIRALLGHVRAASGTVRVRGIGCTGAPPHEIARQGIAYVPEGRGVFANLTVRENLLMAARPGKDHRREWTLERVLGFFPRLAARLHHGGHQLSGGEQQMLAIGRALLTNPDLLVLDEATEGLAPRVAAEAWGVLAGLRRSGMATLIVDRNYRLVLEHTDRCVVMEKGRVVLAGRSPALRPEELAGFLGV